MTIQSSINSFGTAAMNGNTAGGNIEGFIYTAMNAFYHTSLNFVGQNYGARNKERVKKSVICATLAVTTVGVIACAICFTFKRFLLGIYLPGDTEAIEFGVKRMSVICTTYFLCGIMEVSTGALRGIGSSMSSLFTSLFGSCVFRVVWIFTVFEMLRTHFSLYISYPISWTVTTGVQMLLFAIILNR
jgi:Na+-driven multidrug efflux pump